MGIKYYKPTTAGRRNASVSDFAELTDKNKKPEKSLVTTMKKRAGRNNQGFITVRSRGGGSRRMHVDNDLLKTGNCQTIRNIEFLLNRFSDRLIVLFVQTSHGRFYSLFGADLAETRVGFALPIAPRDLFETLQKRSFWPFSLIRMPSRTGLFRSAL